MAEFNLQIGIDAAGARRGAKEVNDALGSVGDTSKKTERGMKGARREARSLGNQFRSLRRLASGAIAAFAGFTLGRQFIQLSDQFTQFNNRLQLVTSSSEELATVQAELIRQSKSSFVSLQAQAQVFQRVSKGAGEFGFSQQDALKATDALAKAVRLSGVDAASASSALVQLGQGIAAGALRGQELNSVLEQTPRVAQAIADAMGVSIGQLRALGEQGAISVERLIPGLIEQLDKLDEETAKLTPTVAEAFQNLQTELQVAVGDFNAATGATEAFSSVIRGLEALLPAIAGAALTVAENLRQIFEVGRTAISGLTEGFGLLGDAIFGSAEASGDFGEAFGDLATNFIPNTIALIKIAGTEILSFFVQTETRLKQFITDAQFLFKNFQLASAQQEGNTAEAARLRKELAGLQLEQAEYNAELKREEEFRLANIALALEENEQNREKLTLARQAFEQARKEREEALKRLNDLKTRAGGLTGDDPTAAAGGAAAEKAAKKLADQVKKFEEANNASIAYRNALKEIDRLAAAGADSVAVLNARIAAREAFDNATGAFDKYNDQVERAKDLTKDMRTPLEVMNEEMRELKELLDGGLISDETFERAKKQIEETAGKTQFMTDIAKAAAEDIQGAFRDLFLEGTDSLNDFADQFGQTLQRVAANFLANQAIQFLLGKNFGEGEFGGVLGKIGGLFTGGGAGPTRDGSAGDTSPGTTTFGEANAPGAFEALLEGATGKIGTAAADGVKAGAPSLTEGVLAGGQGLGALFTGLVSGLGSAISGIAGGIGGGVGGLFGTVAGFFDNGGNIGRGEVGVVGERGPELVGGPASVVGRSQTAAMMAPNIQVAVNNFTDPKEALETVNTSGGDKTVMNSIRRNQGAIRRELGLA
jgi:tape measure domain-containing protein